jgi:hypothetical protein
VLEGKYQLSPPLEGRLLATVIAMVGVVAGIWGLFGGFAVAGLDLHASLRRRGCWPWQARKGDPDPEISPAAYLTGEIIRMIIGAGLAWAAAATGQISGPLGAVGIGAAAPFVINQFSAAVPLKRITPAAASGRAADAVEHSADLSRASLGMTSRGPAAQPEAQVQE